MNTPTRQLPSLITFGVSATAATVKPPTSTPSTSPSVTWNTSTTLQRSSVAPSANDAVQAHTTSHEHVSKYDPASLHDMPSPNDERTKPDTAASLLPADTRVKGRADKRKARHAFAVQPGASRDLSWYRQRPPGPTSAAGYSCHASSGNDRCSSALAEPASHNRPSALRVENAVTASPGRRS